MSATEFEHLVATWADHPTGTACAAAAESLRKQGRLHEAMMMADECVHIWGEFLPGHLVRGLILRDQGDTPAANAAFLGALAIDPSHPVVLQELSTLAKLEGAGADSRAWKQLRDASAEATPAGLPGFLATPAFQDSMAGLPPLEASIEEDPDEPGEEVLTESLAALYQAQGHLERAAEVYGTLAQRTPDNPTLAQRRDALQEQLARSRPRPYDARVSGGEPLGFWLRSIALGQPVRPHEAPTGYDAFYQSPPVRESPVDMEAFQTWLKGLGR